MLNPEMLIPTMNFRGLSIRIDGLETDTELADFGQVFLLSPFADPAYSPNVFFIERPPFMQNLQSITVERDLHITGFRVLGILKKLIDKVGSVTVEAAQNIEKPSILPVLPDILPGGSSRSR